MAISTRFYRTLFIVVPFLLLLAGFLYEVTAILSQNEGKFIYSLDDPYIHLTLANHIAQGHYGINMTEVSAPSSSILWPFLLAPFAGTLFFEYLPMVINVFASAGTLYITMQIIRVALTLLPENQAFAVSALISILLIPTINMVGLAFTGMEHSLQVFLSAAVILGSIQLVRTDTVAKWFIAAIIIAPTVRYECLAVSAIGLGLLLYSRRWKTATIALIGMILPLGIFSLFLRVNNLGWLPNSVIAKVSYTQSMLSFSSIFENFSNNLRLYPGRVMALLFGVFLLLVTLKRDIPKSERVLALLGGAAILVHLGFGRIGWWDRYEIYIIASTVLLLIYLFRDFFSRLFTPKLNKSAWERNFRVFVNLVLLFSLSLTIGLPYYINFIRTPLAARNIYEQQYQMHRFVEEYANEPVAVNDIGLVSYRNPNYVLDLWGLASPDALHSRVTNQGPVWMDRLVQNHKVRLVMIYETWFSSLPKKWVRVARLYLGKPMVVVGGDTVSFFVIDPEQAAPMKALLEKFQPTLPPGVRMDIEP